MSQHLGGRMRIQGYARSVIGGREMNQDAFLVNNDKKLYAVADGVGGGLKGEVASQMAVEGLDAHCKTASELRATITTLQEAVLKEALETIGEALMGTTLTAVLIDNGSVNLCHVGDSR